MFDCSQLGRRLRGPSDAGGNQRATQCCGGLQEMPAIQRQYVTLPVHLLGGTTERMVN
jgi:hypothetical protein